MVKLYGKFVFSVMAFGWFAPDLFLGPPKTVALQWGNSIVGLIAAGLLAHTTIKEPPK